MCCNYSLGCMVCCRGLYTGGRDSPQSVRSDRMMFPNHRPNSVYSGSESESVHQQRRRCAFKYLYQGSKLKKSVKPFKLAQNYYVLPTPYT